MYANDSYYITEPCCCPKRVNEKSNWRCRGVCGNYGKDTVQVTPLAWGWITPGNCVIVQGCIF